MPVFRLFLAADIGVSDFAVTIPTIGVTAIIR